MSDVVRSHRIDVGRHAAALILTLASSTLLAQEPRDEEAIEELRRTVELAPEDATAHYALGSTLVERDELAEGIVHLEKAGALAPETAFVRYELGEALRRAQRLEHALLHFEAAIELDPPAENARLGQAEALVGLERFGEAHQLLEEAKGLLPESRSVDFALAWLLAACPDPELRDGARALELANGVLARRRSAAAFELVAAAQGEIGRCEEAAKTQTFVVEQAARASLPPEITGRLERSLERFERGAPCGAPAFGPATERPHWPRNRADR